MTSTVLDVTVLLLCVSASVVLVGAADDRSAPSGPEYTATDAADRLVTETATVAYPVPGTDGGSRTVHATLVELLTMAATADGTADPAMTDRFRHRALATVADALGQRTRVDVRHVRDVTDQPRSEPGDPPVSMRWGSGVGLVRGNDGNDAADEGPEEYDPVAVGDEPPVGKSVTVVVLTHPGPDRFESTGADDRFHVVVRVW
ncbi:DUF7284 family protein [Halorubrum tibetense]|uniref:Uncharacterized protein n=1 Tax=Halorubrum tibetense TaxID=175631 RepID=A0ABD5SHZ2_9EURY